MKKILLSLLLLGTAFTAMAQTSFETTISEKRRILTGSEVFSRPDEEIFANAMLWAIEQGPQLKEEFIDTDWKKMRFTFLSHLKQEDDESDAFTCRFQVQVSQGRLVFLLKEVKLAGGLKVFTNFDKLQPEKKEKHQDIIRNFERLANLQLQNLFDFVSSNDPKITNWQNVITGKLDEGMSKNEAILVLGKPVTIQQSGTDVQMMYNAFTYVFLTGDTVKSCIR